jgi:hypothetical protein
VTAYNLQRFDDALALFTRAQEDGRTLGGASECILQHQEGALEAPSHLREDGARSFFCRVCQRNGIDLNGTVRR